jgi:integrase/recombinase XerD
MLNTHISRYVALHRSLGRKYSEQDRMLRQYAAYAEGFGDRHTQVQRIYDWCHTSSSQYVARRRFDTARNFSLFAHAEDSSHEVPPAGVFGRGKRPRPTPTIIEPDQVRAIMTAALNVPPQGTISPYTYHYLFGLLAATGLRISEALALQCSDLVEDGLIVRNGKFGKQRLDCLAAIDAPSTRSLSRPTREAWGQGQRPVRHYPGAGTAQGARPRRVRQIGPAPGISWTNRYGGHATPRPAAHLRCPLA